jgi:putative two-component system response regulator
MDVARWHHEKWNSKGYPDGLEGEDIPLSARIMAVVDVYDALRTERPYKKGLGHRESSDIVISGAGTHFDPEVVSAFEAQAPEFARLSVHHL